MPYAKIPTTVFTGFLGAGKTSLIRHLLRQNEGRRIARIINEFGEIGIDREVLLACGDATCPDDDIIELAAQRAGDDALDHETPLEELFEEQLAAAALVVVNKADLLADDDWPEVEARSGKIVVIGERALDRSSVEAALLG